MSYGLYISAEGAQTQSKRLEVIANNMANVDTVGFKRELAVIQSRYAEEIAMGLKQPGTGSIEDLGGGVMFRETKTDHSPGPLERTGVRTDMAIEKEGFFLVSKGNETFLTRAGNFTLTSLGELVTQTGYAVLDEAGSPVVINPEDNSWQVGPDGSIRQQGAIQRLAMVKPQSPADLVKMGENLFRSLADPQPLGNAERRVAAGYLEGSSVRPTLEVTEMIQASRALEVNVNMMKAQDEMLGGLVNRVMRT